MFTGLIEEVGEVKKIERTAHSIRLSIKADSIFKSIRLGESVAVNGVCLTVVSTVEGEFDVMPETMRKTDFDNLSLGSKVNLERAMELGDRFGGHIVTGHIDGTGTIKSIKKDDIAFEFTIEAGKELIREIIYKGSVAIDGVSLTCGEVSERYFKFYLIPHTKENTALMYKKKGEVVNIEIDVIGKYIDKLIGFEKDKKSSINKAFLLENGFM